MGANDGIKMCVWKRDFFQGSLNKGIANGVGVVFRELNIEPNRFVSVFRQIFCDISSSSAGIKAKALRIGKDKFQSSSIQVDWSD